MYNNTKTHTTISQDEFEATYKPLQNHVSQREEWNGWYFETFGDDELYIKELAKSEPNRIWTILDTEGTMPIVSGMHHVNRFGYIVTEVPFKNNEDIEVEDEFADNEQEQEDTEEEEQQTPNRSREFTKDYMKNSLTWQAHACMRVEMVCLKLGKFPNGQTLKQKDIDECNRRIAAYTEVLEHYNIQLPVLEDQPGDQLGLF